MTSGECHTMTCVQNHAQEFYGGLLAKLGQFANWLNAGNPHPAPHPAGHSSTWLVNQIAVTLTLTGWLLALALVTAAITVFWLSQLRWWRRRMRPRRLFLVSGNPARLRP